MEIAAQEELEKKIVGLENEVRFLRSELIFLLRKQKGTQWVPFLEFTFFQPVLQAVGMTITNHLPTRT